MRGMGAFVPLLVGYSPERISGGTSILPNVCMYLCMESRSARQQPNPIPEVGAARDRRSGSFCSGSHLCFFSLLSLPLLSLNQSPSKFLLHSR